MGVDGEVLVEVWVLGWVVGLAEGGALQPLSQDRVSALSASKALWQAVFVLCSGVMARLSLAYSGFGRDCGIAPALMRVPEFFNCFSLDGL